MASKPSLSGLLRTGVGTIAGIRAVAVELTWTGVHLATYPLGLLRERPALTHVHPYRVDNLPPMQRGLLVGDIEAAGTPILLVHGIVDNRSVFGLLQRGLRRRGFGRVMSFSYGVLPSDLRESAARLAIVLEQLCADTGYERIHLIGHSLGGLVARYCVQCLGGDVRVHTLVTLGTPHQGSRLARLVPHPLVRQLRPGSDLMTELAAPAPGCRTRFVSIWSDCDEIVTPKESARLEHPDLDVRSIRISGVGHMSLPINGQVVREVSTILAQLKARSEPRGA